MASITLHGNKINTQGKFLDAGSVAPDFILVNHELSNVSLEQFRAKVKLIITVPSLDTPVCAASTVKLNDLSKSYPDLCTLVVSADLPFAMSRFCSDKGIDSTMLSMMRSKAFAEDYGVLICDGPLEGILARAVFLVSEENTVIYSELVPEISSEPDYETLKKQLESVFPNQA